MGKLVRFPLERRDAGATSLTGRGWSGSAIAACGQRGWPQLAGNLSAVLAAVSLISSSLAGLPASVVRITPTGKVELPDHPVARLIAAGPNPQDTWVDFIEFLAASLLSHGNSLVEVESDSTGEITALRPVPWLGAVF